MKHHRYSQGEPPICSVCQEGANMGQSHLLVLSWQQHAGPNSPVVQQGPMVNVGLFLVLEYVENIVRNDWNRIPVALE